TGISILLRELHLDPCSLPRRAVHGHFRPVQECTVFYDGKAEPGAAPLFGVALVHPVEPLEDPLMMLLRDPDAGIRDRHPRPFQGITDPDGDTAVFVVIFHGILTHIVNHLIQDLADPEISHRFACHFHADIPLLSLWSQAADDLPGHFI